MLEFLHVGELYDKRDSFLYKVDKKVGKQNWSWAFKYNDKFYSYQLGMQMYEDAFWVYLLKNKNLLKELVTNYKEVYRNNYQDLESGLNYNKQLNKLDHYDDIALRRVIVRFGLSFKGDKMLDIKNSEYSELKVPFHLPCKYNTVKMWYENCRYIVIATEIEDKVKFSEMLIK